MIELILARHGQTTYNAEHRLTGQANVQLTELGEEHADNQAHRLSEIIGDYILTSDLQRSIQGAEKHSKYSNLKVIEDSCWRERHCGDHQDTPIKELGYSPEYGGLVKHFYECDCPNGESRTDFIERVRKKLKDTHDTYEGKRVFVHTHGGVIMFALNIMLNQSTILENAEPHKNGHVSYLQMEFKPSGEILVPDKKINVPCQELVGYLLAKD